MINEIVLRRRNKITVPKSIVAALSEAKEEDVEKSNGNKQALSIMKNIESLGFTFDRKLFDVVCLLNQEEMEEFYKELIPMLQKMCGADVKYNPMYPNFPKQVAEMDDIELIINAIVHYWSSGTLMPDYEKDIRLPLLDDPKLTALSVGDSSDYWEIFKNLLSSNTSISSSDKADIETIIKENPFYYLHLPETIPYKENVALLCRIILETDSDIKGEELSGYFKTATDVLRLITSLSDGDISLSQNTKYRKFKRSERRLIMDLLAGCGNLEEDMFRYRNKWLRVGEIIHPFEYKAGKYNKVREAFDTLRNKKKPLFFAGLVQDYLNKGEINKAVDVLKTRPGEFARQLDKVLRESDDPNYILDTFDSVAENVSVPLLFQVLKHFENREDKNNDVRVVLPKGLSAKAYAIPKYDKDIAPWVLRKARGICVKALEKQLSKRESLGSVYIDPDFEHYLAPFSQRSANTATKTLVRGSRVKISDNAKAIRSFIWWTDLSRNYDSWSNDRVDIDLSAGLFDENWGFITHVGWTNLRDEGYRSYHSGDITRGGSPNGDGVAEFIDVALNEYDENSKARYVVFTIHSFTQQRFNKLTNLRFGWMEREDVNSGEIFEPSTVEMSMDVNSDGIIAVPVIFDLKTREYIWCDLVANEQILYNYRRSTCNRIEDNIQGVTAACYAVVNLRKPTLLDVVLINSIARGLVVSNRNLADIIFSNDKTKPVDITFDEYGNKIETERDVPIYTVYDLDYYMGQML